MSGEDAAPLPWMQLLHPLAIKIGCTCRFAPLVLVLYCSLTPTLSIPSPSSSCSSSSPPSSPPPSPLVPSPPPSSHLSSVSLPSFSFSVSPPLPVSPAAAAAHSPLCCFFSRQVHYVSEADLELLILLSHCQVLRCML